MKVMEDVLYFLLIFAIIIVSFSIGLWAMFKPFQRVHDSNHTLYYIDSEKLTENKGFRGIISFLFWRIFDGDFSDAEVLVNKNHTMYNETQFSIGKQFSLEFSHMTGLAFCAVYQGIMVILVINLLIAMMNTTYIKVWENADREWKFSKSYIEVLKNTSTKGIMIR